MRRAITASGAEIEMYIWEEASWPTLICQDAHIAAPLAAVLHEQGRSIGRMEALGFKLCEEAVLQTLTLDVVKTSEIEGE
jgi:Fic family protein